MAEEVAKAFVNHFYTTWDNNPAALGGLYNAQSTLTFERQQFTGAEAIVGKYSQVGKVGHNIPGLTMDVQMSLNNSSMLIFVTGQISIGGGNPLHFSQMFQLVATGPNQYYVHNDIMRLVYA